MNRPAPADHASELAAAFEHLTALGTALVLHFHPGPFRICTRLARTITTIVSPSDIWRTLEPDRFSRADAMLRDIRALHLAVDGLPGIEPKLAARILTVGDTVLNYRAALEPGAVETNLIST